MAPLLLSPPRPSLTFCPNRALSLGGSASAAKRCSVTFRGGSGASFNKCSAASPPFVVRSQAISERPSDGYVRRMIIFRKPDIPLHKEIGLKVSPVNSGLEILDWGNNFLPPTNIGPYDVYVIQPTCPSAQDHTGELLQLIRDCKSMDPCSIIVVMPYARMDGEVRGREDSSDDEKIARVFAESGADGIISLSLYPRLVDAVIPMRYVDPRGIIWNHLKTKNDPTDNFVVVSPRLEGVACATSFSKLLSAPLAVVSRSGDGDSVEVKLTGDDVKGKIAIIVEDIIDTNGIQALGGAAKLLSRQGAKKIYACATHIIFSTPGIKEILSSDLFDEVIVTNSIPISKEDSFPKLQILSVAQLLADSMATVHDSMSGVKGLPDARILRIYK